MRQKFFYLFFRPLFFAGIVFFISSFLIKVNAQENFSLANLSDFKTPSSSWHIAGDAKADINTANSLKYNSGVGILLNVPDEKNKGADLYTNLEHGDADLELDYMMAKGSNSGIYLQGRYEIQLFDSWGKTNAKAGDNGGIYERWDEVPWQRKRRLRRLSTETKCSESTGLVAAS